MSFEDHTDERMQELSAKWAKDEFARRRRSRGPPRAMSPMDELRYFDLPLLSSVAVVPGAALTQICTGDPRRVVLGISVAAGGTVFVSPGSSQISGVGFQLNAQTPNLLLLQHDHGPLPQVAWFASTTGGTSVFVCQVLLRSWGD